MKYYYTLLVCFLIQVSVLSAQDGILDNSFDLDGIRTLDISNSNDVVKAIVTQPDGKMIVAGYTSDLTKDQMCLVRFNEDGSLDADFGNNGIVSTEFPTNSTAADLVLQPDGKIIVAGDTYIGSEDVITLVRYLQDGTLDNTFGTGGIVNSPVAGYSIVASSVVQQTDGKILVGGQVFNTPPDGTSFLVVRYQADGVLDTSFGEEGIVVTDITPGSGLNALDLLNDLAVQADGKILATGISGPRAVLVRYHEDGSLDADFGLDGIVAQNFSTIGNSIFNDLDIQADGKIITAGFSISDTGFSDCLTVRYNTDGSFDLTFGESGVVVTSLSSEQDIATSILIQPDNKILLGGVLKDDVFQFALVRYDANGNLDPTFGIDGTLKTAVSSAFSQLEAITLQADGKILAAGYSGQYPYDIAIVRYTSSFVSVVSDEGTSITDVTIYPNPTADQLYLSYHSHTTEAISIEVYNHLGQSMQRTVRETSNLEHEDRVTLELEHLPAGMYYIAIGNSEAQQTFKVVKE